MPLFRPGKPYANRRLSGDYAPGAGPQTVSFDAGTEDGEWGAASTQTSLVVELPGLYVVTASARRTAPGSNLAWIVNLTVSGIIVARSQFPQSGQALGLCVNYMDQLENGDALALTVESVGTGSLDSEGTHLSVARVGPVRWT